MKKKLLLISLAVMTAGNIVAHIFGNINETGNCPSGEGAFNKVKDDWRDSDFLLNDFGFTQNK